MLLCKIQFSWLSPPCHLPLTATASSVLLPLRLEFVFARIANMIRLSDCAARSWRAGQARSQAMFERAEAFAAALRRDLERCAMLHAIMARERASRGDGQASARCKSGTIRVIVKALPSFQIARLTERPSTLDEWARAVCVWVWDGVVAPSGLAHRPGLPVRATTH